MNIGILTFHCAYNYGAVLQCYALQKHLESLGFNVTIINYTPFYLASKRPKVNLRTFVNRHPILSLNRYISFTSKLQRQFDKFLEFSDLHLNLSKKCKNYDQLSSVISSLDTIIIGSDQVWSETFNGKDSVWYGQFPNFKGRVITYAASAGDVNKFKTNIPEVLEAIKRFDSISVREVDLQNTLSEYGVNDAVTVVDPTLLLDMKSWSVFFDKPIESEKYILVYQGRDDDALMNYAKSLGTIHHCKVISCDFYANSFQDGISQCVAGPKEFLNLVHNAFCVITSSFHGTALSILLETRFFAFFKGDGGDIRAKALLESLNLCNRIIDRNSLPCANEEIDWNTVKEKITLLKERANKYLLENA